MMKQTTCRRVPRWMPVLAAFVASVPVMLAAEPVMADAAKNRDVIAVKALVARGADANAAQTDGTTALHWAAHWEDAEMVAMLIHAHANVNAANRYGYTPLLEAATSGDAAIVRSLLDANSQLSTGQTALMFAARTGHVNAIRELLDHGAAEDVPEAMKICMEHGDDVNAVNDERSGQDSGGGGREDRREEQGRMVARDARAGTQVYQWRIQSP